MPKSALLVSYSNIERDPRVLRQIQWLTSASYEVVTIGLGESPTTSIKTHFQLKKRSLLFRTVAYVLVRKRFRYLLLIEHPNRYLRQALYKLGNFDLVVFNDIDLLPLAIKLKQDEQIARIDTRFHLDLHEYFPDHGIGLTWRLLFKCYSEWLQTELSAETWDSISTVSPSIAELYEESKILNSVSYILSAPKKETLQIARCSENRIDLVYHGTVDLRRGLMDLVNAVQYLDNRFHLNLVLVGSARNISKLERQARNRPERIHFWDSVPTTEIAKLISRFDIEVIFYIPKSLNLLHALPNKYLEAVQANLAIIHGQSPSMQTISDRYGNGITVGGWTFEALIERLNLLTTHEINSLKTNSSIARSDLCSEVEGVRFLNLVEGNPK